jgi:hypothetical protein
MPSLVFRLWVLLLAVLVQVGSWHAEASSQASMVSAALPAMGDFDAPEDCSSSEELSATDDSFSGDVLLNAVSKWHAPAQSGRWRPSVAALPPGGPPSDTPFKPPRG